MKIIRRKQLLFTLFLSIFHIPYIFESLWYDEAAVLANSYTDFWEFDRSFNWLQTIPPGYLLLAKFILKYEFGIFVLRLFSLLALVYSIRLIDNTFFNKLKYQSLSFFGILAIMVSNFSMKYATDAKPYAFEMLLSLSILTAALKQKKKLLYILVILAPLFASTTFVLGLPVLFFLGFKYRIKSYILQAIILLLVTWRVSDLVAPSTKLLMTYAWFGDSKHTVIQGIRTTIGGLFWIPVSGMGWIPDDFSKSNRVNYQLSSIVFLLVIIFIGFRQKNTDEFKIIQLCFLNLLILNIFQTFPVAGRLLQGVSSLLTIMLICSFDDLKIVSIWKFTPLFLVVFSAIANYGSKWSTFEPWVEIENFGVRNEIYSTIDLAPEIQFFSKKRNLELNQNILSLSAQGIITGCRKDVLERGDRVYVYQSKELIALKVNGFKFVRTKNNVGYYEAMETIPIEPNQDAQEEYECIYLFRNSEWKFLN